MVGPPFGKADIMHSQFTILSKSLFEQDGVRYRIAHNTKTQSFKAVSTELLSGCINRAQYDRLTLREQAFLADAGLRPLTNDERDHEVREVLDNQLKAGLNSQTVSMVIMPTSQCNLGCEYCGQQHSAGNMPNPIEDRVLRRLEHRISRSPGATEFRVSWFGGEPLLGIRSILRPSKRITEIAAEANLTWVSQMPTNGLLLSPKIAHTMYDDANLRFAEVTIDGPENIHDQSRPQKNPKHGTNYQSIVSNLAYICSNINKFKDLRLSVRVNVHEGNVDSIEDLLQDLADRGLNAPAVSLNIVPVYDWGTDTAVGKIDRKEFAEKQLVLLDYARTLHFRFSLFPRSLVGAVCTATDLDKEVIGTRGHVFTCTEQPLAPGLDPERSVGHVLSLDPKKPRPRGDYDDWVEAGINGGVSTCRRCPILPICGGACPKQWFDGNVPCPPWRYNMPERLDRIAPMCGLRATSE